MANKIRMIGQIFVDALKDILDDKLYGIYLYGAVAFPDTLPTGDIDFHVIVKSRLTNKEKLRLEEFHESIDKQFSSSDEELDGYYLLLKDAKCTIPPKSQMWSLATDNSWALHREHILAGRHIILYGPEPQKIYKPATWAEIEIALFTELDYIEKHVRDYPDYCILNLCRLIYSFETRNVVISKDQASNWAYSALPQWKQHIKIARESYPCQATPENKQFMLSEVDKFLTFAKKRIKLALKKN